MTPRLAFAHALWAVSAITLLIYFLAPGARSADDIQIATGATVPARAASPDSEPPTPPTGVAHAPDVVEVPAAPVAPTARRLPTIPGTTLPVGGLNGMPFAPDGLERCAEMEFYRRQAGLPDRFDGVGFRESSCHNDVSSWCCHGYWQLHEDFWVPMPECHIVTVDDVLGDDPIDKQRNACAAAVVYEKQGGGAWDAW